MQVSLSKEECIWIFLKKWYAHNLHIHTNVYIKHARSGSDESIVMQQLAKWDHLSSFRNCKVFYIFYDDSGMDLLNGDAPSSKF